MSSEAIPRLGTFHFSGQTQTAGTAIAIGIPPWRGGNQATLLYAVDATKGPNWNKPGAITHITKLGLLTGSTAHSVIVMRPFNWTTVASAAAINQAVINITADPGIYSTNYKYPSNLGTGTAAVANNAIAASDYVAFQLVDGTWVFDTVSSVSTLAITMTTSVPNVTGGGVAAGAPFFFFGISTDKDPATGAVSPTIQPNVSVFTDFSDVGQGIAESLHSGDPLLVFDGNATAADTIAGVAGFYGRW